MTREESIHRLRENPRFHVVVVGGGITGAGIFRRIAASGYRVLLLEARDFAWGTSSRSGKMVHGGLRYIKQGQLRVSYHSVRERERLLREMPHLVFPLRFALPVRGYFQLFLYRFGLLLYELFAGSRRSCYHRKEEFLSLVPGIRGDLMGGYSFYDALTDDALLTLQVLLEGEAAGGVAVNYARVTGYRDRGSRVEVSFRLEDGTELEVESDFLVLAAGAWANDFTTSVPIRKLKGSHLLLKKDAYPVPFACALVHPRDKRPLYILPWRGCTLLGTTDVDYWGGMDGEFYISQDELEYLVEALEYWFPSVSFDIAHVVGVFAGVRAVVDTGKKDPSKEARDYAFARRNRVLLVTGGKLTTFDYVAHKASLLLGLDSKQVQLKAPTVPYEGDLEASLRWMAEMGHVVHLEDLMVRRLRLALTVEDGGMAFLDKAASLLKGAFGWDGARWERELERYRKVLSAYKLEAGNEKDTCH